MADYGHDLSFGIFVTPRADAGAHLIELARRADAAGLDWVSVQDHPYQPAFLDAWTLLTAIATATATIGVFPNVANLPLRPPAMLARAAARLGDSRRAAECFGLVTGLATTGIDSCHPVILTAHYDEAIRCAALGDTSKAAKLLEPVLDRTLLAHGRPALSDAHPLLARARALAERLGITVPYAPAGLDEASLDIDA